MAGDSVVMEMTEDIRQQFLRGKESAQEILEQLKVKLVAVAINSEDKEVHKVAAEIMILEQLRDSIFREAAEEPQEVKPKHDQDYGGD